MSVTPDFVGQRYKDTTTGNVWIANSTTAGDWSLDVQEANLRWEPRTVDFSEQIGFYTQSGTLPGITDLVFLQTSSVGGFEIGSAADIETISFPNLVDVDPGEVYPNPISAYSCDNLTSISAPNLQTIGGGLYVNLNTSLTTVDMPLLESLDTIEINGNTSLTSLSLPALQSITESWGGIDAKDCTLLADVSLPSWLPTNESTITFNADALTATSVNHILARCVANAAFVSGTVDLAGGTNAAPSGQGVTDKNTLVARGVSVTTN